MTRKSRRLAFALIPVAVLITATVLFRRTGTEPPDPGSPPEKPEQFNLTAFPRDSLRLLRIMNSDGGLTISSMDGVSWVVDGIKGNFRVKDSLLRSMTSNFSSITGTVIEEDPEEPAKYGLEIPAATVTLVDSAGNETTVYFGNPNPSGKNRYARIAGDSAIYLVPSTAANMAFWSTVNIREDKLPTIANEAIVSVTIRSGGELFRTEPHSDGLDVYRPLKATMDVIEPWDGRYLLDDHVFQRTITTSPPPVRISGFVDRQSIDPANLGLGEKADRIVLEMSSGSRYDMEIGNSDGKGRRYAREQSYGDLIFLVDENELELLDIEPFKHTNQFVFLAGIDRIMEVTIVGIGVPRVLSIEKLGDLQDDSDGIYRIDGFVMSEQDFKKAYQSVIGLLYEGAARRTRPDTNTELEIRFTHVDPDVPAATVQFKSYDKTYYLAGIDGEAQEFIIGRYQIQLMLDALDDAIGDGP